MTRPRPSLDQWRVWLEAIEQDIFWLHTDRMHWREVIRIAKANPRIQSPHYVLDWITRMYISHTASGIRRQMEESPSVVSIRKLLSSIHRNPSLVTRSAFVKAWCAGDESDEFDRRLASEDFDDFAGPGRNHVNPALVKGDLDLLRTAGAGVKTYVDERIAHFNMAHTDSEELAKLTVPTFQELDDALSLLGTLLQKYHLLLKGGTLGSAEPAPQHNWTLPFTVAWLPEEDA